MQIKQIYEIVAPQFIEPILNEGIKDGSLEIENPGELSEMIMILNNIWLNPLVNANGIEHLRERCNVYHRLLKGVGIELFDDAMIEEYLKHCTALMK